MADYFAMNREQLCAEKAELESYGAQLTGRIAELETSIYEKRLRTEDIGPGSNARENGCFDPYNTDWLCH